MSELALLLETVKRRKVASVGGVTRWRRVGRPDPRRSMLMKRAARKGTARLKRKMAMRRLMRSSKGQRLRRFRSMIARKKSRTRTHRPRTVRRRRR